jgi:transposase
MRLTTAFNRLLSLQGAFVRQLEFQPSGLLVKVARRAQRHRCPHCTFSTRARYDAHHRDWRHVALGKWRVTIRAELARLDCPRHGVVTEAVPWAEHESRFTRDFEDLVAWLTREMNKTAVVKLMRIAWETVGAIVERVVARTLDKARLDELYAIGLDEVSYRKGQKYLSVVMDYLEGTPVWIEEGRSRKTVGKFFDELGAERTAKLKVVSIDMCAPYIAEVQARAPSAVIAFDPFHVVKLANEAVHQVRRGEMRKAKGTPEAEALKGTRWALLKAPENQTEKDQAKLSAVAALNKDVYRAYLLKEELRALYRCTPRSAPRHLDAWIAWARRSRLKPFVRTAATLTKYREGVLNAIRYGVTNGPSESLNGRISMLKHRAFGFHSATALIAMVFLCCTRLPIRLPT